MIQRTLGVLQGETWKESFNSWTRGKKTKQNKKSLSRSCNSKHFMQIDEISFINQGSMKSSVQFSRSVRLFGTLWITARQASLSSTNSRSSLKLMSHWVSDAVQPSHPLSSPSPPAPNPSQNQGLSQRVNSSHEMAKVLEFQL